MDVLNMSSTQYLDVVCPMTSYGYSYKAGSRVSATIRVSDQNDNQVLRCYLETSDISGWTVNGGGMLQTGGKNGIYPLQFKTITVPVEELYSFYCQIPPMLNGRYSGVVSYSVDLP